MGSRLEARWILDEVLGPDAGTRASPIGADAAARATALAERRRAGAPLQYLFGHWPFRQLDLVVDPRVLIPRAETEQLVDVALEALADTPGERPVAVDLGTGSGAIGLSLAVEGVARRPGLIVLATDTDDDALAVAALNRRRVGGRHPGAAERVRLRRGDWWSALPDEFRGRVGLVAANPPYVAADEWGSLDAEVRAEPYGALVAGPATDGTPGLGALEAIVFGAPVWMSPGAPLVVELAPHQAEAAAALAERAGLVAVDVAPDLSGRARFLRARHP